MTVDVSHEIDATLGGNRDASRRFVAGLRPIVQARVARVLLRNRAASLGRNVQQEVDDLTQEVFVALFDDGGRLIRRWSPERGLSLANFVGLVAQRQATKTLLSRRRGPWGEQPTDGADLERIAGQEARTERELGARQTLRAVLAALRAELSPRGQFLFQALLVDQRPIADLVVETGMSRDALYAWRSRLARRAREIREAVSEMHLDGQDLERSAR